MSAPTGPTPVPSVVDDIAAGRPVAAVWVNELGGVTFQIGTGERREFVKTAPAGRPHLLTAEAERMRWAARFTPVPRLIAVGDGWLHTAGMPGRSAVDPRWLAAPRTAVRAIGSGLRRLHDTLPVAGCPFDWSVPTRLRREVPAQARATVGEAPPVDRMVVCHGDACAPNTLIGDDGAFSAHVDLGDLGVADRWADIAVALLSLSWNFGPADWEDELLAAYGVRRDAVRIDYYQRLWQAGDA
ncbi:aminoglycoside 3'-phosphotransferase [Mycobacterium sp. CPCC 205372]|uniref:Aminoglycoside 3'-phosphotransferase n=1 Tax=Mycobacterium hippophais TaxID=3016340 RepID=A0ABT4PVM6_9MYCO|nr:aminoglycoside 3'-phosphotransferase [Mycobacterium hippophais]MCZ8380633.1 aminoglycoside 3'-phosphotransferase [Mycobacterium hippophais]